MDNTANINDTVSLPKHLTRHKIVPTKLFDKKQNLLLVSLHIA